LHETFKEVLTKLVKGHRKDWESFVESLLADIKNNYTDEVALLKSKLIAIISKDTFNKEHFKTNLIQQFLRTFLKDKYLHPKINRNRWKTVKDNFGTKAPKKKFEIKEVDLIYIEDEITKVALSDVENDLRKELAGTKILTAQDTIVARPAMSILRKKYFLSSIYKIKTLEDSIAGVMENNPKRKWDDVVDDALKKRIFKIKRRSVAKIINEIIKSTKPVNGVVRISIGITNQCLYINGKIILDTHRLTTAQEENLVYSLKNIIYCRLNRVAINQGEFLTRFRNMTEYNFNKVIKCSNGVLITKLFRRRNKDMPFVVVNDVSSAPPKGSFTTVLPHDYEFPEIHNTKELFAAFKATERCLYRYYKYAANEAFLRPNLPLATLKKVKKRSEIVHHDSLQLPFAFRYKVHGHGTTTIVFDLTTNGLINPHSKNVETYAWVKQRLNFYKSKGDLTDVDIAKCMRSILRVSQFDLSSKFEKSLDANEVHLLLLHFTFCLFMIEGIRNKASFITHALVLGRVIKGELTLDEAIKKHFPMAPTGSTAKGRKAHDTAVPESHALLNESGVSAKELEEFQKRENNVLSKEKDSTLTGVSAKYSKFWKGPKIIKKKKINIKKRRSKSNSNWNAS